MERKKIVTIGGGTGSSMVLRGLKKYPVDISAVVSMADDGGATGILRSELDVLPPGDVRQCLVALSSCDVWLDNLMNYRFDGGSLKGQTVGNIMLAALEKTNGNFSEGSKQIGQILKTAGQVIPVSEEKMNLHILLNDGKILVGEKNLDHNVEIRQIGVRDILLKPTVSANPEVLEKIRQADMIIIGPGDMYGSVLPIFLVEGVIEEIKKSKALVVFNCSLTNRKGQTDNFDLADYLQLLEKSLGDGRIDWIIINSKKIPATLVEELEKSEGKNSVVIFDQKKKISKKCKIYATDVLSSEKVTFSKNDAIASSRSFIRHDSDKLAKVLMEILGIKNKTRKCTSQTI